VAVADGATEADVVGADVVGAALVEVGAAEEVGAAGEVGEADGVVAAGSGVLTLSALTVSMFPAGAWQPLAARNATKHPMTAIQRT